MTDTWQVSVEEQKIKIGATGREEIFQNVRTILSTMQGAVFLDRGFGFPIDMVDAPTPLILARMAGPVIKEIENREPRVKVVRIDWEENIPSAMGGVVTPKVTIQIRQGVLDDSQS